MRKIWWAATAAVAALLLTPLAARAEKTTLIVGAAQADAGQLDPHMASAGADKGMLAWIFNSLVRMKPGRSTPDSIEPDLAESWTSNPAGTEWTFKLRSSVQCHAGYGELTADDVVYSLKRSADPKRSAFAADFSALQDVQAIDAQTVKITLKTPVPSLLGLVSNYHGGHIVCKKAAEEMGENFRKHPIGTGPFMFAEYQTQRFVRLTANKDYFRGAPKLQEIIYRYIPSDSTRDLAFESGELDMIFGKQDDTWIKRMRQTPGVVAVAMEPAELNVLHLNATTKPLDDIRVRQAVLYAVDRAGVVKLRGETANRAPRSVIPGDNVGAIDLDLPPHDPEKAKALLAAAGYPNGITLKTVGSSLPTLATILEAVQAQLKKANITLEIETVDHPTYHAQIRKDLSPVVLYQAARFPVADVYLSQFYYGPSTVGTPTAVTNFSHCTAADAEIQSARVEPDREKQKALWAEAQRKILGAVCGVPIYESLVLWAYKDTLDLGYDLKGSLNLVPMLTEATHFKN
jgi:peptide/nickel transport system substrate-binding protein